MAKSDENQLGDLEGEVVVHLDDKIKRLKTS